MKKIFSPLALILLLTLSLNAQWIDHQAAEFVIGQPDFSGFYSARTAIGLDGPCSVAIDFQHSKLYIGDAGNHRILRYAYPITGNQPTAEIVFGQTDFVSDPAQAFYNATGSWPAPTKSQILYPMVLIVNNGDLWVLDEFTSRVVKFSQAYNITINNPNADIVIGQKDFISLEYKCTSSSLISPWGMAIDDSGNLWVADTGNGRILRFGNISGLTSGTVAIQVLGQPDFTTGTLYSTPSASQFGILSSICMDGTTLWVSDRTFNRVLKFNNAANKAVGANADGVLGQGNFTTSTSAITPSTFNHPVGVCADGKGNLYVSDQSNNRVLIFLKAANKPDGADADNVLGQTSFYNVSLSYGSQAFAPASVTTFAVDNTAGKLFVVDRVASRVLQFAASGTLTGINKYESTVQNQLRLSNYPNPFNSTTYISFILPTEQDVDLAVFDDTGRQLSVIVSEKLPAGPYKYQWNAKSFPAGVYLCRLRAGISVETKKIILKK